MPVALQFEHPDREQARHGARTGEQWHRRRAVSSPRRGRAGELPVLHLSDESILPTREHRPATATLARAKWMSTPFAIGQSK